MFINLNMANALGVTRCSAVPRRLCGPINLQAGHRVKSFKRG
jgi:hypothetical protein